MDDDHSIRQTGNLWRVSASTMAWAQVVWRLAPWALSLASIRARPAFLSAAGVGRAPLDEGPHPGSSIGSYCNVLYID